MSLPAGLGRIRERERRAKNPSRRRAALPRVSVVRNRRTQLCIACPFRYEGSPNVVTRCHLLRNRHGRACHQRYLQFLRGRSPHPDSRCHWHQEDSEL